jgi:hypothetical protein
MDVVQEIEEIISEALMNEARTSTALITGAFTVADELLARSLAAESRSNSDLKQFAHVLYQ